MLLAEVAHELCFISRNVEVSLKEGHTSLCTVVDRSATRHAFRERSENKVTDCHADRLS